MTRHRFPTERAFSLVEGLLVAVVLGIISSLVIPAVTGGPDAAKKAKLDQDVLIVNNAIDSFLAAGGSQAALSQAGVIEALKQRVYGGTAAEMVGPQGPFLDPAVVTNATDFAYSAIFLTTPRPRFVVERSTVGVVFDKGLPSPVGGVAARADSARPGWLWSYSGATAPAEAAGFNPLALDTGTRLGTTGGTISNLLAPVFVPASTNLNIWDFPLLVSILNPNTNVAETANSSLVYYRVGGGSYTLYDGTAFPADPGVSILAIAISTDPSRFGNSPTATSTYTANKLVLAVTITSLPTVTYAQAGGQMSNQAVQSPATATISLIDSVNTVSGQPDNLVVRQTTNGTDKYIPPQYLSSAGIQIRYTLDGSDPATNSAALAAPNFSGSFTPVPVSLGLAAWGSNASIQIRAVALAANTGWFSNSTTVPHTVSINPTLIGSPTVAPVSGRYINSVPVTITAPVTNFPTGGLVIYTTNGTTPAYGAGASFSSSSTSFTVRPVGYGQSFNVSAIAVGPSNYSQWFTPSSVVSAVYSGPNFNYGAITGGVLVSGGTIGNNASLRGSVVIARVTNGTQPNLTFENNTALTGDIFAPGTPRVAGLATNRIVDLDGDINPTNYTVTIGSGVVFSNSVYRRITPVVMPSVTLPTGLTSHGTASSGTLPPGYYTRINPGNNATITLGVAGSTTPSIYLVDNFSTGNGARVNVVGPVILVMNPGAATTINIDNNVVVGNSSRPEWLQIQMFTGNFTLGNNGSLYGTLLAPAGTVTFQNNSTFKGAVTANTFLLNNNGSGITFSLPPPQ